MQRKLLLIASVLWSSLHLSGCATTPPDVPICLELSPTRGWCTHTLSDREFYIDDEHPYSFYKDQPKMSWWELRPTLLLVPSPSYAALKAYIVKTCRQQRCDAQIGSWERRVKRIDERIDERNPKQELSTKEEVK
jgi:hypothetical protein